MLACIYSVVIGCLEEKEKSKQNATSRNEEKGLKDFSAIFL